MPTKPSFKLPAALFQEESRRVLTATFFCIFRQQETTIQKCLDLFLFSNTLKCADPELFSDAIDPNCFRCPKGHFIRFKFGAKLPPPFVKTRKKKPKAKTSP